MIKIYTRFLFIVFSAWLGITSSINGSDKMMWIIIDGARYSETFGDTSHTYIPNMWNLSHEGSIIANFYNDSLTETVPAIAALNCGTWTEQRDTVYNGRDAIYTVKPTLCEYFRKQKNLPAEEYIAIFKYSENYPLFLNSFDPDYGPDYWPLYDQSVSEAAPDAALATRTLWIMDTYHPHFIYVHLWDVDFAAHRARYIYQGWRNYTSAIQQADGIVATLWNKVQSDSFYLNSTTLFVTNDHGRHDDQHGGFYDHGCGCEGCRHIMFLAVGPEIKQNYVSSQYRRIPDVAVTAAKLLGIQPEKATGEVMEEILLGSHVDARDKIVRQDFFLENNFPNPFNPKTHIRYHLSKSSQVLLKIYNLNGEEVKTLVEEIQMPGLKTILWDGRDQFGQLVSSGVYVYSLQAGNQHKAHKMLLLR